MRREFISGILAHKGDLKEVTLQTGEKRNVIDYAVLENKILKNITAWGENARKINEIPKNTMILSSCLKQGKETNKIINKNGKEYSEIKETLTCERLITDKEQIVELYNQFDNMMKDYNEGKIDSIYVSKEASLFEVDREVVDDFKESIKLKNKSRDVER